VEDAVHLGFQNNEFANIDWITKIDVVHGSCDHVTVRMAAGRHGRGDIHQVHHMAAEQFTERIRDGGQNDFRHFGARCADGFRL